MEQEVILSLRNITKTFPGVKRWMISLLIFFKGEYIPLWAKNEGKIHAHEKIDQAFRRAG